MRENPFRKFLTKEQLMHEACVIFMRVQFPKVLFTHPDNEGRKTPFERWLYKILGVKTGMCDILIFKACKGYHGLAIELKVPGKKATPEQVATMNELKLAGWLVIVCDTSEQFRSNVIFYLKN